MIPLQHIHPMLVHFPIVFVFVLAIFDTIATLRGHQITRRNIVGNISTSVAVLAALFAVATYFFGDIALEIAESNGFSSEVAEIHEALGLAVAVTLSLWAIVRVGLWWSNARIGRAFSAIFPAAGIAAAVLVGITAYFGGELVFGLGVNVARAAVGG
jgi:uncharacterized membrane protein